MPITLFKFPKVLKPSGPPATTVKAVPTKTDRQKGDRSLVRLCSKAILKPSRRRGYSNNTLETAQCLSDNSLVVFPLEEPTQSTSFTTQQEDEAWKDQSKPDESENIIR